MAAMSDLTIEETKTSSNVMGYQEPVVPSEDDQTEILTFKDCGKLEVREGEEASTGG